MNTPENLRYSKDHEWCRLEGGQAVMGLTDFAQRQLGDVVFVELPKPGERFEAGDEVGTVESVKAVSEIYAPLAGTVKEVNEAVRDEPELLNTDPYGDGWIVRIAVSDKSGYDTMLTAAQYEDYCTQDDE